MNSKIEKPRSQTSENNPFGPFAFFVVVGHSVLVFAYQIVQRKLP